MKMYVNVKDEMFHETGEQELGTGEQTERIGEPLRKTTMEVGV